jgi:protocatechuate 3,4-dioxygenase beta subunit
MKNEPGRAVFHAILPGRRNWQLESCQHPPIGMSALRSRRNANIPVCGFTELSSSVFRLPPAVPGQAMKNEPGRAVFHAILPGRRNWQLESCQHPPIGMSALRARYEIPSFPGRFPAKLAAA